MYKAAIVCFVLAFLLAVTSPVAAHVTVNPSQAVIGWNTFVVRVPTEREVATTRVRLEVPDGADVMGIKPVPGWTAAVTRESEMQQVEEGMETEDHHAGKGRITEIVWSGGQIEEGQFQEFPITVRYAGEPGTVTWNAYQTYADGEVVSWDGTEDGHPASSVTMEAQSPLETVSARLDNLEAQHAEDASQLPMIVSVVAVLLSGAALARSMKK